MEFDSVVRNPQARRNFLVGESFRQHTKNSDLAFRKFFDEIEVSVGRAVRTCGEEITNECWIQQKKAASGRVNR